MIKFLTFEEFELNEIGDASAKPFKWEKIKSRRENDIFYETTSPKSKITYAIVLLKMNIKYELIFYPKGGDLIETNAGDLFGLMSTIMEIMISFVHEYKPEIIFFNGIKNKTDSDDNNVLTKRNKLYMAYIDKVISKEFPNVKIEIKANTIYIKF